MYARDISEIFRHTDISEIFLFNQRSLTIYNSHDGGWHV